MLRSFFSRYNLNYPRFIAYMLQSSEYNIAEYLAWHNRVRDFSNIEKRKKFVATAKGIALLTICWTLFAGAFALAILSFCYFGAPLKYLAPLAIIILTPFLVSYGAILPLFLLRIFVQIPVEAVILKQAKRKIQSHKGLKIAIAGSFGKTSAREIIKTVLSEGKKVASPPHNYNTPLGISRFVKTLSGDEEVLIFELGEYYPGDIKKLCDLVGPDMGVITGINEAHLEKFKTLDRTVSTIFELADFLKDAPVYVNGDNKLSKEHARAGHVIYSCQGVKDWKVSSAKSDLSGTEFVLKNKKQNLKLKSQLLGLHQIGHLALASIIAKDLGLSDEEIARGINKTAPFEHRLSPSKDPSGAIILDDSYNGNPDGVKAVIDFLASLKNYRRFYLTPGLVETGEKNQEIHEQIGRQLASAKIEKVILIRNSATPHIASGLEKANYKGEIIWFDDMPSAINALPHLTIDRDLILIQNDWPDQYQ